jgi:flavin reductase (DIM6/NTAB) family NADH-FMN oxidoreductase RutF
VGLLKEVTANEAWLRKYPERTALVVSVDQFGKPNLIAVGWNMPTSYAPPMAAISVGVDRYSHKLIREGREFVLVFPSINMENAVVYCGTHSGRDVDKFKETGLTPVPAKYVRPPLVKEAAVNMECRLVSELRTGDHTIFVGEILAAYVSDEPREVLFNLGPDREGSRVFAGFLTCPRLKQ